MLSAEVLRIAIDAISRKLDDPSRPFADGIDELAHYAARAELQQALDDVDPPRHDGDAWRTGDGPRPGMRPNYWQWY